MNKIYCLVGVAVAALIFYLMGERAGRLQCAKNQNEDVVIQQSEIVKLQGDINAETFNRGVADIRRVLREKYTITE